MCLADRLSLNCASRTRSVGMGWRTTFHLWWTCFLPSCIVDHSCKYVLIHMKNDFKNLWVSPICVVFLAEYLCSIPRFLNAYTPSFSSSQIYPHTQISRCLNLSNVSRAWLVRSVRVSLLKTPVLISIIVQTNSSNFCSSLRTSSKRIRLSERH